MSEFLISLSHHYEPFPIFENKNPRNLLLHQRLSIIEQDYFLIDYSLRAFLKQIKSLLLQQSQGTLQYKQLKKRNFLSNSFSIPIFFYQIHSFLKKYEIETLNYSVVEAVNSEFQSDIRRLGGEIAYLEELAISLPNSYHTPRISSSKWIPTPPAINRTHTATGIAVIPKMVWSKELPVHPKNPNNNIRDGTPFAITIPKSSAPIWASPHLEKFFHRRGGTSSPLQKYSISNNSQKDFAGKLQVRMRESITTIVIISLMLWTVTAAVTTVVTYLLYVLFEFGSEQLSTISFMCAISGAACLMFAGLLILMDAPGVNKEGGK